MNPVFFVDVSAATLKKTAAVRTLSVSDPIRPIVKTNDIKGIVLYIFNQAIYQIKGLN